MATTIRESSTRVTTTVVENTSVLKGEVELARSVRFINYNPATDVLTVSMLSGEVYSYAAVTDADFNAFAATKDHDDYYHDNIRFNFVETRQSIEVSVLTPLTNATGVSVSSNLTVLFTGVPVKSKGDIFIYQSDGTLETAIDVIDAQVTINTNTVTINPTASLTAATTFYVNFAKGSFVDVEGNPLPGISGAYGWRFTTA
jgi:uncharacterized Zn-binding protein involved in type VI secretion